MQSAFFRYMSVVAVIKATLDCVGGHFLTFFIEHLQR